MTPRCPRLQVLIATYGCRIESVDPAWLPRVDGVEYVVTCQNPDGNSLDTSRLDSRDDIEIYYFADKGVSRNRNHGLDIATADYILISDDDIAYDADALVELISTFDADDDIDIVTTRSITPETHIYPLDRHNLDKPYRYYLPIAFEIALRRRSVVRSGVRFAESISIGTRLYHLWRRKLFLPQVPQQRPRRHLSQYHRIDPPRAHHKQQTRRRAGCDSCQGRFYAM